MIKQRISLIALVFFLISIPLLINKMKNEKVDRFEKINYQKLVEQSESKLNTLIKEKQNTTTTIAINLANNEKILSSIKSPNQQFIDLQKYSLNLRNTTDFKNVWFHLVDKNGISLQRSWTSKRGDNILHARKDMKALLKNPKSMNTISVGIFDMTFKAISPIYDKEKNFLGVIEVITHFNSISKKLKNEKINTVILADKSYKNQIKKPFSKKFVHDYYVANLDADVKLLKHLESVDIARYIKNLSEKKYIEDKSLNKLISYYSLPSIDKKPMGHFLMFQPLDRIDTSKVSEIKFTYNILLTLSILIIAFLIYLNLSVKKSYIENINKKLFLIISISFLILFFVIYLIIHDKYESDIESYSKDLIKQSLLEYNSILNSNSKLANMVFKNNIDNPYIKSLFKSKNRDAIYNYLDSTYQELVKNYNIRQVHFHNKDSSSFLRMHRPNKYGDSLIGIRDSVEYVNRVKKPYTGFEEGRIYNGFRHVYPLIDANEHLGSVEISYNIYAFIDEYIKSFDIERVNFLINKEVVNEKVFKSEKSNYLQSPIEGFYFDKIVLEKLKKLNVPDTKNKKDKEKLASVASGILKGNPFVKYFDEVDEVIVVIPLLNQLNGKVGGALTILKPATFIKNRTTEFNQLIAIVFIILAFIMLFTYREIRSKIKLNLEHEKNQAILDSQKSFIIITNGEQIKASNRSMLEFFGYETFEKFQEENECICDLFLDEYGYIKKQMGDVNWFEYISQNSNKDNQIIVKNTSGEKHIFFIEFDKQNKVNDEDYIVSFIDITNIKNMEQILVQKEKMAALGEMIGNIAHQWRQPLSIISTSASGMQVEQNFSTLTEKNVITYTDTIIKSCNYLSETIETFSNFIKGTSKKSEVKICELVKESITLVKDSLNNNYIDVIDSLNCEEDCLDIVYLCKGELIQVIINILNNAKDIILEREIKDGWVKVEQITKNNKFTITIEDNAGGIPEDILPKIFEPYFTTKHQSQGTGLGLHMSYKIITEAVNGKIWAENTENGAKFFIEIPLNNKAAESI